MHTLLYGSAQEQSSVVLRSKDFSVVAVSFSEPKKLYSFEHLVLVLCNILFGYSQLQGVTVNNVVLMIITLLCLGL